MMGLVGSEDKVLEINSETMVSRARSRNPLNFWDAD